MDQDHEVVEITRSRVKQSPNLPIPRLTHEVRGIMVNKGRIHMELVKFLMISLNLIKLDDESVIDIRKFDILRKRNQRRIEGIKIYSIWI